MSAKESALQLYLKLKDISKLLTNEDEINFINNMIKKREVFFSANNEQFDNKIVSYAKKCFTKKFNTMRNHKNYRNCEDYYNKIEFLQYQTHHWIKDTQEYKECILALSKLYSEKNNPMYKTQKDIIYLYMEETIIKLINKFLNK